MIQLRILLILGALVALSLGCPRSPTVHLSEVNDETAQRQAPPSGPVLLEITTDRAEVVRLIEPQEVDENGRLQITSSSSGASVRIDDQDPLPLPLVLEVGAGVHEINALCNNGTRENFTVTVDAGDTVHLHICGGRR